MTNKDILANQIIVDINSLIRDTKDELNKDDILYSLKRLKAKIKDWNEMKQELDDQDEMDEEEEEEAEAEAERDELLHHQNYEASVI